MSLNNHATSCILTTPDRNRNDLNMFDKYGHMNTTNIQAHTMTYITADTIYGIYPFSVTTK